MTSYRFSKKLTGVACALVFAGYAGSALAATALIQASKDNTLYEDATGSLSNGAGDRMFAGRNATPLTRRAVMKFNLPGTIPAGSTVTAASVTLTMVTPHAASITHTLKKMTQDWGEGTSVAPSAQGGGGASTTNDATWKHAFFSGTNWTGNVLGGVFSGTVSSSVSVSNTGPYTWPSTAQMVADVQGWLNAPATNFGWILLGDETAAGTAKGFSTHEAATTADRPLLTVTYTPPAAVQDWSLY